MSQRNIYIFPSPLGFAFLALLLLMLLTAINYQNSLIYLITFFLGTVFFLSIWMCFLNLSGLSIEAKDPGRCFEGDASEFNIRLLRQKALPLALKVGLNAQELKRVPFTLDECADVIVIGKKKKRGRHTLDRLYIESRFPFGMVVAWTWLKLESECWVYPAPVFSVADSLTMSEGEHSKESLPTSDLNQIRTYQHGDTTRRILWKKYAAKDELVVRDADLSTSSPDWVDWNNYSDLTEDRLKHLSFDVCQLSELGKPFGFRIPGCQIDPGFGELHKKECLDALALF